MSKKTALPKSKTKASTLSERLSAFFTLDRVVIGGSIGAVMLLIGIIALNALANQPIDIEGVERVPNILGGHQDTPVDYQRTPPARGLHYPVWQNCGAYEQPIGDELAVHSLEHAAVWITYSPDLPAEEVENFARDSAAWRKSFAESLPKLA